MFDLGLSDWRANQGWELIRWSPMVVWVMGWVKFDAIVGDGAGSVDCVRFNYVMGV